jgi:hypothetical protein
LYHSLFRKILFTLELYSPIPFFLHFLSPGLEAPFFLQCIPANPLSIVAGDFNYILPFYLFPSQILHFSWTVIFVTAVCQVLASGRLPYMLV